MPCAKNNLFAVLAISVVEFSHGLAVPFIKLSVGKQEGNSREVWGQGHHLAQISVILARHSPAEKLDLNRCKHMPCAKNNLFAVLAISVVEFSHGLAVPFMELFVSKPQRNSREV